MAPIWVCAQSAQSACSAAYTVSDRKIEGESAEWPEVASWPKIRPYSAKGAD